MVWMDDGRDWCNGSLYLLNRMNRMNRMRFNEDVGSY